MAVNQARIFEQLEQIVQASDPSEFIYGFLTAFKFPKATITQIRQGGNRNVAKIEGHVGLKNKLYYLPVNEGQDIDTVLDEVIVDPIVAKNKIRYILITDFERFLSWDTATSERLDIDFEILHRNYSFFLPLVGLEKAILNSEKPADVKAAVKMGKLFDLIRVQNDIKTPEDIHELNVFLTRLLFCLFAEDTGIFPKQGQFTAALKSVTSEDGSDLDQFLFDLFLVLNSKEDSDLRSRLPEHLTDFPYVNGGLFEVSVAVPRLGKKGRRILIECGLEDWSAINPDIFGSMFQAVIDVEQRARLGQHYTSYSNIMKVIQPLFLDPLRDELEKQRNSANGLKKLLVRLGEIKIFDPACGSGNFLIIAYKELRLLEIEAIQALMKISQGFFISNIHLDQFYGVEVDDFACEIARLSLWLAEHQINKQWEEHIGPANPALPLKATGKIVSGNSLQVDWNKVCPKQPEDEVYLIGNPPFVDAKGKNGEQRKDMLAVFEGKGPLGGLDYVACWFWKGSQYIQNSESKLAFVSTNSLTQGEQVATLWNPVFELGLSISFAYQTFAWANNAREKAAVHVVVIGLSMKEKRKVIFQNIDGNWHSTVVSNISPYLIEGNNTAVKVVREPLTQSPKMLKGNEATDDGFLVMSSRKELTNLLEKEPEAENWVRPFLGGNDFLNGGERWCLWLDGITGEELRKLPEVTSRVEKVRVFREKSSKAATRQKAKTPWLFGENRQPLSGTFIVVPKVSSERRQYVPLAFADSSTIVNNTVQFIPHATLYHFAILQSKMHISWMNGIGGKMKSDYQYSIKLIYNTFCWPDASEDEVAEIEKLAEEILLVREDFPGKTLAELYDPDLMPHELLVAHESLDLAIDKLYRPKPFHDNYDRLNFLLSSYEKLTQ